MKNRILRLLKINVGKGVYFKKTSERNVSILLVHAGRVSYRQKCTLGDFTYVWGNLVTRKIKKQGFVARSSTDGEFRTMIQRISNGLWIYRALEEP